MLDYLSVLCLSLVSAICWTGVFAKTYKDNIAQCAGLIGLGTWSAARAYQLWDYAFSSPQQLSMHVALALFFGGTAWKVWKHREPKKPSAPAEPPAPLPNTQLRHVVGGSKTP